MTRASAAGPLRAGLLVLLLAGFAWGKTRLSPGDLNDGDFYLQIAHHVARGHGLVSDVSLYNQGWKEFPHRVNQSPVWLLALGHAGRWFGLAKSGRHLPELLYGLDLVLLYLLANRLWRRLGQSRPGLLPGLPAPDLGHVAVFWLGANAIFFRVTSLPLTEAMAFAWLFASLLALDRAFDPGASRSRWAAAAGALATLAWLTRTQMVGAVLGIPLALALPALRERRLWRLVGAALAGSGAVLLPWVGWLASWAPLSLAVVAGQAELRETPELRPFDQWVPTGSAWGFAVDRLGGLLVAFHPAHRDSYAASFGWGIYLVPLALLVAAAGAWRRRRQPAAWLAPEHALPFALLLCGAAQLLPVHLAHATYFREWLFGYRHGLPMLLLLLLASGWLLRRPRDGPSLPALALRGVAALLVCASLLQSAWALRGELRAVRRAGLDGAERALADWVAGLPEPPTLIATNATTLGLHTRARYHWTHCSEPLDQIVTLLDKAGADYFVFYKKHWACAFVPGWEQALVRERAFGRGAHRIVLLRRAGARAEATADREARPSDPG